MERTGQVSVLYGPRDNDRRRRGGTKAGGAGERALRRYQGYQGGWAMASTSRVSSPATVPPAKPHPLALLRISPRPPRGVPPAPALTGVWMVACAMAVAARATEAKSLASIVRVGRGGVCVCVCVVLCCVSTDGDGDARSFPLFNPPLRSVC